MNDLGWTDDVASGGQAGNFPPHQTPLFSPLHMHAAAAAHPLNNQRARYCMPAVPRPVSLPATRLAEARRIAREMLACRRKVTDPCNAAHSTDFLHAVKPPFCTEGCEYEEMTF